MVAAVAIELASPGVFGLREHHAGENARGLFAGQRMDLRDRIVQIRHRRVASMMPPADQRRDFGTGDALLMVVGLAADNAGDLRDRRSPVML